MPRIFINALLQAFICIVSSSRQRHKNLFPFLANETYLARQSFIIRRQASSFQQLNVKEWDWFYLPDTVMR